MYLQAGSSRIFVYPSEFAGTNQATATGFDVEDIAAAVAELRGKGVTFEEYDMPGLKTENGIAELEGREGGLVQGSIGQHPLDRRAGHPGLDASQVPTGGSLGPVAIDSLRAESSSRIWTSSPWRSALAAAGASEVAAGLAGGSERWPGCSPGRR